MKLVSQPQEFPCKQRFLTVGLSERVPLLNNTDFFRSCGVRFFEREDLWREVLAFCCEKYVDSVVNPVLIVELQNFSHNLERKITLIVKSFELLLSFFSILYVYVFFLYQLECKNFNNYFLETYFEVRILKSHSSSDETNEKKQSLVNKFR